MVAYDIFLYETGVANSGARTHTVLFVQYLMAFGDDSSENLSSIFFLFISPLFSPWVCFSYDAF